MTSAEPRLVLRSVAGISHLVLIAATAKWCLDLSEALPAIWIVVPIAPLLLAARGLYQDDGKTTMGAMEKRRWTGSSLFSTSA